MSVTKPKTFSNIYAKGNVSIVNNVFMANVPTSFQVKLSNPPSSVRETLTFNTMYEMNIDAYVTKYLEREEFFPKTNIETNEWTSYAYQ
mgnify:FL=1